MTEQRSAEAYFDTVRFLRDVRQYAQSARLALSDMARLSRLEPTTVRKTMTGQTKVTLLTVLSLARMAKLSVDDYRKEPDGPANQRRRTARSAPRSAGSSMLPVPHPVG